MIYVLIFYYWRSPWEQDVTSGRTIRYLQSLNWSIVIPPSSFVLAVLWPLVTNGTRLKTAERVWSGFPISNLLIFSPSHTYMGIRVGTRPIHHTQLFLIFYTHTFVKSKVIKKKKKKDITLQNHNWKYNNTII